MEAQEPVPDGVARLTPDEGAGLTAEENQRLLADPDVMTTSAVLAQGDAPPVIGKSWAFDFLQERFIPTSTGGVQATHGLVTLRYWVEKCLRTPRGQYAIYSQEYGVEGLHDMVGFVLDDEGIEQMREAIKDALTNHPVITDVINFETGSDPDDETLLVSFTVVTADGDWLPLNDLSLW